MSMNADDYVHIFRTAFGLPPSKDDKPICGATLTDRYDFPGRPRPMCPQCTSTVTIGVAAIVRDALGEDDDG